jgi:predicted nuclease of restriction endonuclease-like (RecB) superfamily
MVASAGSAGGWSRNVLVHQIESKLLVARGMHCPFDRALSAPQSDLAQRLIKDPYNFDFLSLAPDAQERELAVRGDTEERYTEER